MWRSDVALDGALICIYTCMHVHVQHTLVFEVSEPLFDLLPDLLVFWTDTVAVLKWNYCCSPTCIPNGYHYWHSRPRTDRLTGWLTAVERHISGLIGFDTSVDLFPQSQCSPIALVLAMSLFPFFLVLMAPSTSRIHVLLHGRVSSSHCYLGIATLFSCSCSTIADAHPSGF